MARKNTTSNGVRVVEGEMSIIIRTDGSFVNSATGSELLLKDVIAFARKNREANRATINSANAEKKAARIAKRLESDNKRRKALELRKAKLEAQLAKLAA